MTEMQKYAVAESKVAYKEYRMSINIDGLPWCLRLKNLPALQTTWIQSICWEGPLKEEMATQSYSCLENPHGQRSLAGYGLWGRKEWDTTEWLSTHIHKHRKWYSKISASHWPYPALPIWNGLLEQKEINVIGRLHETATSPNPVLTGGKKKKKKQRTI